MPLSEIDLCGRCISSPIPAAVEHVPALVHRGVASTGTIRDITRCESVITFGSKGSLSYPTFGHDLRLVTSSPPSSRKEFVTTLRQRSYTDFNKMSNDLKPRMPTGPRLRQAQDAKNMQQSIAERCRKKGIDPPDYEFLELIGKGNYGRVYKSRRRDDQHICAVKIIEVDKQDYKAETNFRDDTINEFIRETSILRSLKDNNAKNVNVIYDAFAVDTQLWIVSEYCPGGSLSTLIKASPKRSNGVGCLEEPFIIPIAREVAVALKYVHEAGVIHRDIKCANILVTEDGRIQLCDFGVSGFLEHGASKRTTIIGTPHWMAPELVPYLGSNTESVQYGTEIDCWAYGCAVFEMATGFPPNHRIRVPDLRLRRDAPRLVGNDFSEELKDFVAFCLQELPDDRPTAARIIDHQYIKDTNENYPTNRIRNLIERFAVWEESGNQRESLFNPFGAQGPDEDLEEDVANQEWNFSTSIEFQKRMSMGLDPFGRSKNDNAQEELLPWQKHLEERRIQRGEDAMKGIFNTAAKPYKFGDADGYDDDDMRISDLPFRNLENGPVRDRTTMIDLDFAEFDEGPTLDLDNVPTIRARRLNHHYDDEDEDCYDSNRISKRFNENQNPNRATMEWTFPSSTAPVANPRRTMEWSFNSAQQEATVRKSTMMTDIQQSDLDIASPSPGRPALKHANTMPADPFGASRELSILSSSPDRHSLIDLDSALSIDIPEISRPPTANSIADSAVTDMTSGDPFDLETELPTIQNNRGSFHMKSQSEPTAAFQMSKPVRAVNDLKIGEVAGPHNRSSSMNRSEVGQSPLKRRWQGQSSESIDAGHPPTWDPFAESEETVTREPQPHWSKARSHHRRMQSSLSSNYTASSSQGSIGENSSTLRPSVRSMATFDHNIRLKLPRPPNLRVLLPQAAPHDVEEELSITFEELGHQADTMISLLNRLILEEEGNDLSSISDFSANPT